MTTTLGVREVHDREDKRGDSDEDWPERDEEVRQGGADDRRVASHIFKYVKPVTLNDNGCKNACSGSGQHTTRIDGYERGHAQRIIFKIGSPSPMRRSIASARRFCSSDHPVRLIKLSRSAIPNREGGPRNSPERSIRPLQTV